jgi:hypothetical protein
MFGLTRKQVRYIVNGFNEVDDGNNLVSHSRDLKPGESSVEKLLQSLRDKGFGHCVLYNQRNTGTRVSESVMVSSPPKDVVVNEIFGPQERGNRNLYTR